MPDRPRPLVACSAPFHFLLFLTDPATPEIYTLSLHDALPISVVRRYHGTAGDSTAAPRHGEFDGDAFDWIAARVLDKDRGPKRNRRAHRRPLRTDTGRDPTGRTGYDVHRVRSQRRAPDRRGDDLGA